ncbi:MAG: hypothetical protein JW892_00005, partial [Anaerolineae bacterium]|nr:hypothetical protein [Anaerolineae bacterium]
LHQDAVWASLPRGNCGVDGRSFTCYECPHHGWLSRAAWAAYTERPALISPRLTSVVDLPQGVVLIQETNGSGQSESVADFDEWTLQKMWFDDDGVYGGMGGGFARPLHFSP